MCSGSICFLFVRLPLGMYLLSAVRMRFVSVRFAMWVSVGVLVGICSSMYLVYSVQFALL